MIILERKTPGGATNNRMISGVKASMDFEGLKPSTHAKTIGKQYLEDKITSGEAVARIKARHASEFGR